MLFIWPLNLPIRQNATKSIFELSMKFLARPMHCQMKQHTKLWLITKMKYLVKLGTLFCWCQIELSLGTGHSQLPANGKHSPGTSGLDVEAELLHGVFGLAHGGLGLAGGLGLGALT